MSELNFEIAGATGILTLNRPEARNALTMGMYRGIADTCANPPEEIKALIITGAGDRAFAAGTDINHFRDFGSAEQAVEYERSMDEVLEERLGDLGIPLVLNLPLGHGQPNRALPLGPIAELDGRRGSLRLVR